MVELEAPRAAGAPRPLASIDAAGDASARRARSSEGFMVTADWAVI